MNYLAHTLLSPDDTLERLGNLAGDFAKGSLENYHPQVRKGLMRHRAIDSFTDTHPIVKNAKASFPKSRRRVAGILLDLCFDHFLAKHWSQYNLDSLGDFLTVVYSDLNTHLALLPTGMQRVAPFMIEQNWLASYARFDALSGTIDRIASRLSKPDLLRGGASDLIALYPQLEQDFEEFFPKLVRFSEGWKLDV